MSFLKYLLLRLRELRGHVYLACASMKRNGRTCFCFLFCFFFLKKKITDKLISAVVNEFAAKFESFVLSPLAKYQQFCHMGPWSATYDPRELTFLKADKENLR